jgi:hypothetical protein
VGKRVTARECIVELQRSRARRMKDEVGGGTLPIRESMSPSEEEQRMGV